jgi:hypothetical protein
MKESCSAGRGAARQKPGKEQVKACTSSAKVVVIAHDGAGIPVKAAAVLVPHAGRILVRGAAVVQHAIPEHLQPAALQLCYTPALQKSGEANADIQLNATPPKSSRTAT